MPPASVLKLFLHVTQIVELTIWEFEVNGYPGCYNDYLAIYDGNANEMIEKICGYASQPIKFYSYTSTMKLTFHSDEVVSSRGFLATFIGTNVVGVFFSISSIKLKNRMLLVYCMYKVMIARKYTACNMNVHVLYTIIIA